MKKSKLDIGSYRWFIVVRRHSVMCWLLAAVCVVLLSQRKALDCFVSHWWAPVSYLALYRPYMSYSHSHISRFVFVKKHFILPNKRNTMLLSVCVSNCWLSSVGHTYSVWNSW